MRRLLLISGVFPLAGNPGRGAFIAEQAKLLVDAGVEVRVVNPLPRIPPLLTTFSPRFGGIRSAKRVDEYDGMSVLRPRYTNIPQGYVAGLTLSSIRARADSVQAWTEDWIPDMIHSHGIHPQAALGSMLAQRWRRPHFATVHGWDFDVGLSRPSRGFILDIIRELDGLIVVNEGHRNIAQEAGVAPPRLHLLACHLEVDERWKMEVGPIDAAARRLRVLFGADPNRREKDHRLFLAMLKELGRRGWSIEVDSLGGLSKFACCEKMSQADIVVLTSRREGSSQVLKEAVFCGRRVVTTDVGDASSWLPSECISNQRTPAAMADALEAVVMLESAAWSLPDRFSAAEVAASLCHIHASTDSS